MCCRGPALACTAGQPEDEEAVVLKECPSRGVLGPPRSLEPKWGGWCAILPKGLAVTKSPWLVATPLPLAILNVLTFSGVSRASLEKLLDS